MFAVVSWHDSVQDLAVSRRDGGVSSEVCVPTHSLNLFVCFIYFFSSFVADTFFYIGVK